VSEALETKVRAVFLDAGQTLLDADPPVRQVYGDAFARYGVAATEEALRQALVETWAVVSALDQEGKERWAGREGERGFWRFFVQHVYARVGGGELPDELFTDLIAHFADVKSWRVYDDAWEVLAALRAMGLKLVVVSNWDSTLPRLLDALELTPHFDAVVVSAIVGAAKPSARIFEAALELAGVAPGEALHVGDSPGDDYHGARAAGLRSLLLDRRGCAGGECEAIRSLAELPARLRSQDRVLDPVGEVERAAQHHPHPEADPGGGG